MHQTGHRVSFNIDSRGAQSPPGLETTVIFHLHADPDFTAYSTTGVVSYIDTGLILYKWQKAMLTLLRVVKQVTAM